MNVEGVNYSMQPAPVGGGFAMDGYWVWCGSVVQGEDGKFHMFASRWPKSLPMHPGWLIASEIVRAVSDTPEGPYSFQEVVMPARGAAYWDGRSTHNPHIVRHKDTYLLYYMGSTHPFEDVPSEEVLNLQDHRVIAARSNKRVGLATATSVLGPWKRLDAPILTPRPDHFDSYFTSNPAPCVHEDGSVLLIYKSRHYIGHQYSYDMALGAAWADHYEGPYRQISNEPIFSPASIHLEDPFIWKTEQGYAMIAKDMEGNIAGERHAGIQATSVDGLHWVVADQPGAYSRRILWSDGMVREMGNFERPFLLFQEGRPTHLFAATANGTGEFTGNNTWNMVIPLTRE